MDRSIRLIMALVVGMLIVPGSVSLAQTNQRCFPETGLCIEGRIREYWEQNGGLPVFGLPITPVRPETIEGREFQVQWFERNRLEIHPENQRPYDILLGRLGADLLSRQGRDPATFPQTSPQAGCRFFAETGHNVCGDILQAWRASGLELDGRAGKTEAENLALFGLPLSDVQTETLSDGKTYEVQWFERARFERHPENQPPYTVLLGLLGRELIGNTPPPPPAPRPAPTFNNCRQDPNPQAAVNQPIQIISIDKRAETVTLKNVSNQPVSLDGWRMCSIKGNQLHPIGGVLNPGSVQRFSSGAHIWNNVEKDDGALYDPEGVLISYWNDQ